jgi:hypothetical protein
MADAAESIFWNEEVEGMATSTSYRALFRSKIEGLFQFVLDSVPLNDAEREQLIDIREQSDDLLFMAISNFYTQHEVVIRKRSPVAIAALFGPKAAEAASTHEAVQIRIFRYLDFFAELIHLVRHEASQKAGISEAQA